MILCPLSGGGDDPKPGVLQPIAARILMKILWVARLVRFDLLRAVGFLATKVCKWTQERDRMLTRLVAYMKYSRDLRMIGWIGDPLPKISPHLYADADFAGCVETMRSTSGDILVLRGPHTSFPIAAYSKRQGCVSHSTPEAELVSMDHAMRTLGLPSLSLWDALLPQHGDMVVHEDNSAMIRVVETGRNPNHAIPPSHPQVLRCLAARAAFRPGRCESRI